MPWDEHEPGDVQHMAMELSRYNKVLYVNPPQDILQLLKGSKDKEFKAKVMGRGDRAIRREGHSLWVLEPPVITAPVNLLRINSVSDALIKRNNRKLSKAIFWAMNMLEFDEIIHINDNDVFGSFYMKELLMPELSVFYLPAGGPEMVGDLLNNRFREALIRKSDIVVTNSDKHLDYIERNNMNVFDIGQGVDFSGIYIDGSVQYNLSGIKRPVIGYAGNLDSSRICFDYIYDIARSKPDYSIVLAGEEDEALRGHVLHEMPNVTFIAEDRKDKMVSYMNFFDVCIYPLVINEANIEDEHNSLLDVLYLGKPVVTMNIEPLSKFKEFVYLASARESWMSQLDKALAEKDLADMQNMRKGFAESRSWANCVKRLCDVIESVRREFYLGNEVEMYTDRNNIS